MRQITISTIVLLMAGTTANAQRVHFDVRYMPSHPCERNDGVPVAMYIYYHPGLHIGAYAPEPQMLFAHWMDGLAVSRILDSKSPAVGLLQPQESGVLATVLESSPLARELTDDQTLQGSAVYVVRVSGDTYRKTAIPCAPSRDCGMAVGLAAVLSPCEASRETITGLHQQLAASAGWCVNTIDVRCRLCGRDVLGAVVLPGSIPRGRIALPWQPMPDDGAELHRGP